ncbi:MAG: hypothetical protein J6A25_09315 [Lachnospiraceae bacterium]|nr:hypothetical protein [Lachnospiraceae bacterium]
MSCITDYMKIKEFIDSKLSGCLQGTDHNQWAAKPVYLEPIIGNEVIFNELYTYLLNTDMNTIIRTKGGAIAKGSKVSTHNCYAWDIQKSSLGVMLTIILGGELYVLKFGTFKGKKAPEIYPSQAFAAFDDKCLEYGIDLDDYKIENGLEVKETIESPLIEMLELHDENHPGLSNVHHIDFHNSYPAGLANTHPEFRPVIEELYALRKVDPMYKAILNYTIGWMQSSKNGRTAEWANLSKDAIADNNRRIEQLACILRFSGRKLLGFNTDGIWYQGDIYHGPGEGKRLGEWENDHINCLFRAKSNGAYEFIENGKYQAVLRGQSTLDASKPDRTSWVWGDIYKAGIIGWKFDYEKGIYFNEI